MSKKTRNILLALYIVALSTLVTGATFAFFTVIKVSNVSPRLDVETANLNFISFDIGNPIFINPTVENFKEGMDSLSDTTFASAYLRRDQGSEKTMVDYNVLLNIEENIGVCFEDVNTIRGNIESIAQRFKSSKYNLDKKLFNSGYL